MAGPPSADARTWKSMHCAKCFFYETNVGDETCGRCGRAFLPEANVYLGLLVLVTGGAAWVLRGVLTGDADPLVRPTLDLGAWATWPVSIVDRPAYGLIIGAWLGMLAAAPILTGILYGKRGGWLLSIMLAVVGPSLTLAAVTALGVWVAAGWTLRLQSKLVSALAGLAPIIAYWFIATALTDFGKSEVLRPVGFVEMAPALSIVKTLPPALRSMAYVPPVVGALAAVLVCLMVVGIGWADRWHVRWTAVTIAALAAAPAVALVAFVGVDEIRYGYLQESEEAAGEGFLESRMQRYQEFLTRYPSSPRAAEVGARLAIDIEQIENGARPGPAPRRSSEIWQDIAKRPDSSPWAADAWLHLGDAAARNCLFDEAAHLYATASSAALAPDLPAEDPLTHFSILWDLFTIGPALGTRAKALHLAAVRDTVRMHQALIQENLPGTEESKRAMALYFKALALRDLTQYRAALKAAGEADPTGPLADNVACDLAMLVPDDLARAEALRKVIATYPGTDGAMLAHLGAANAYIDRASKVESSAWRPAWEHLQFVRKELDDRAARKAAEDPYAAVLGDIVQKRLVLVKAHLPVRPGPGQAEEARNPPAQNGGREAGDSKPEEKP